MIELDSVRLFQPFVTIRGFSRAVKMTGAIRDSTFSEIPLIQTLANHDLLTFVILLWRRSWFFRTRCSPETDEMFSEISHAGSPQSLTRGRLLEGRCHAAPFLKIPPEFRLERQSGRVVVDCVSASFLNLLHPIMSFIRVSLHVVENHLFARVQAHAGNVRGGLGKTTANAAPTQTLHFKFRTP
jgi:hypothetical protein